MRIFVKTMQSEIVSILLRPGDTVGHLKYEIQAKLHQPKGAQVLIFAGRVLRDDSWTMVDCNIQKDSVVRMVRQMQGGGDKIPM